MKQVYEYNMVIDGESYKALFLNHTEASEFIVANVNDGSAVTIKSIVEHDADALILLKGYTEPYLIEIIGAVHGIYRAKWYEIEDELVARGLI